MVRKAKNVRKNKTTQLDLYEKEIRELKKSLENLKEKICSVCGKDIPLKDRRSNKNNVGSPLCIECMVKVMQIVERKKQRSDE